jgi:prepilin-type N-terminal cleavage/methylation domain-containing protein
MLDAKSITNNRPGRLETGYTLMEILVVLALIGIVLAITVGMMWGPRRNQKRLLAAGRQFSMDIREAVQEARTRSTTLTLEIRSDRYLIYIESDSPADGYQTEDELILERPFENGIVLVTEPTLPSDWGSSIRTLEAGDVVEFNGMGFSRQTVAIFNYEDAPVYQTVCTRIYNSGDSDVYRYDPENSLWLQAPLG